MAAHERNGATTFHLALIRSVTLAGMKRCGQCRPTRIAREASGPGGTSEASIRARTSAGNGDEYPAAVSTCTPRTSSVAAGTDNIIALARPRLERLSLQTGETAALAVWRQGALTYVEEVGPPAIVAAAWLGQTVPLHATSTGKVLLAFGDGQADPRRARRGLERFTETTITTLAALDEQLAQVRLRGYATCRGEY